MKRMFFTVICTVLMATLAFSAEPSQPYPGFVLLGDSMIYDEFQSLTWLDMTQGTLDFASAQNLASSLEHGGYSDWRLPSIAELKNLGSWHHQLTSSDPGPFATLLPEWYWTTDIPSPGMRNLIHMEEGGSQKAWEIYNSGYLLAVRDAMPPMNQRPEANAGPDVTIFVDDFLDLAGSATDPEGDEIAAWLWEVVSAPEGSTAYLLDERLQTTTFGPVSEGTYILSLRARDERGLGEPDTITVTVVTSLPPSTQLYWRGGRTIDPVTQKLTGARYVPIGDKYLHVDFIDGTIFDLYKISEVGHNGIPIRSEEEAYSAMYALDRYIIINESRFNDYDFEPWLINGIEGAHYFDFANTPAQIITPYLTYDEYGYPSPVSPETKAAVYNNFSADIQSLAEQCNNDPICIYGWEDGELSLTDRTSWYVFHDTADRDDQVIAVWSEAERQEDPPLYFHFTGEVSLIGGTNPELVDGLVAIGDTVEYTFECDFNDEAIATHYNGEVWAPENYSDETEDADFYWCDYVGGSDLGPIGAITEPEPIKIEEWNYGKNTFIKENGAIVQHTTQISGGSDYNKVSAQNLEKHPRHWVINEDLGDSFVVMNDVRNQEGEWARVWSHVKLSSTNIDGDSDRDGIHNKVDRSPTEYSSLFHDRAIGGTTYGKLRSRIWGNILSIHEDTNPSGVIIKSHPTDSRKSVNVCGDIANIFIDSGSEVALTCGSVTLEVIGGSVEAEMLADNGTFSTVSLAAGEGLTFDEKTAKISVPPDNPNDITALVNGDEIAIAPGETVDLTDADGDSYYSHEDCDDTDPTINPGATEICDGIDNDCNSQVDDLYVFGGFKQPINADGSSIFKAGRIVPVKLSLEDCGGAIVSTATVTLSVSKITDEVLGTSEELEAEASGNSNSGNLFRYDDQEQLYIYNLNTKELGSGTYRIWVIDDLGGTHFVDFSLR